MRIQFNNITAKVILDSPKEEVIFTEIRRASKVKSPGAEYTRAYIQWKKTKGKAGWDGKVDIYKKVDNTFPTGLLPTFVNILWREYKILPYLIDNRKNPQITLDNYSLKLRSYQEEGLTKGIENKFNGLWWPRGIFEQATGAGKTELAIALYEMIKKPTLFVVHLKSLGKQTIERFNFYGFDSGMIFDGVQEIHDFLNVATIQTLTKYNTDQEIINLLEKTQQVFFDEAHLIAANASKGNWFVGLSSRLPNAFFRWGLTATPFKKDDYSNLLLAGATGSILHSIKNKELIQQKFLTPAIVKMIKVPAIYKCPSKWPDCYDHGILLNKARTDLLIKKVKESLKPIFIFTIREAHISIIKNAALKAGIKIESLTGKNSLQERSASLDRLQKGKIEAIVCTTIFDEGINFPSLRSIIMAGGGKSEIKTLQRLGRGLRLNNEKDFLTIIDFVDNSSRKLKEHSNEREKIYRGQGFKIEYE